MARAIKSSQTGGTVRGTLSEKLIRALLENDHAAGKLVSSRGGKINRKHYAGQLGCTPSALTRFVHVFSEYEQRLGIQTGPLRHLAEMREWLIAAYDAKQLNYRDGKLDRSAFQTRFGLRGGKFISAYPQIRALFDEFDARAEAEMYLPLSRQKELNRVLAALADGPVLNKDRKSINLVALAEKAKVPKIRLREKRFADAIVERQAEILAEVKASKIDPFVHGRVFQFSELATIWPTHFLEQLGMRFKQVAPSFTKQTLKIHYLQLVNMLSWMGMSSNPHCIAVVNEATCGGRVLSGDEWEEALFAYRAKLVAEIAEKRSTESSVDNAIKYLRVILDHLSSGKLIPATSTPLPGIKHVRRRRGRQKSVAEASQGVNRQGKERYVVFARERLQEVAKNTGLDLGKEGADEFINGLAAELSQAGDLSSDVAAAVRIVLERRLDAIRTHATTMVEAAIEAQERGCELLELARIDGDAFEAAYSSATLGAYERTHLIRSLFPHARGSCDEQIEKGIANLISLINQRKGGIPPRSGGNSDRIYGQFFTKRYREYGGLASIAPLLNPEPDAVGAVLTLYLLESGANLAVGRTLDRDCLEPSDLEGYRRITGHKARAKGKPIIVDLPETSPAVRVMEWLLSAGTRLKVAANVDKDRLFLMRIGSRVQLMTPHWYTAWFQKFTSSVPGMEGVKLAPHMIRPSVLLHAALNNEGRLATGMALGQHSLAVTQGYQQKWPTRLLYDENIRRFQSAFETLIMSGVGEAASKLGIAVDDFEARLGELRETGLGTFCQDQRGRPGERNGICSTLDCWNDCPHLLIVAEVDAIASLQLWQTSLRAAQPDWERDRPERWDEVWLPWLCLTDVVEEKMVRGPMIKVWKSAQIRAAEISAQPGYVPPRPW